MYKVQSPWYDLAEVGPASSRTDLIAQGVRQGSKSLIWLDGPAILLTHARKADVSATRPSRRFGQWKVGGKGGGGGGGGGWGEGKGEVRRGRE